MNFSALTAYLDSLQSHGVPGCDLLVSRGHETLYRHQAGFRDEQKLQPLRGDETYRYYSCTKLFTTCAVMQLVERGILSLDDPVSLFLPAYGKLTVRDGDTIRPARRTLLIRHLMSMQSGLDYDRSTPAMRAVLEETDGKATTMQLAEAKAKDPLHFEPGTDFLYSLSHSVLGAVIEAATGLRFSEYLRRNIFEPLGIRQISFELSDEIREHLCMQYQRDPQTGLFRPRPVETDAYRITPNVEGGGGGLMGGVEEYARFVDALACGGVTASGSHILSPEMIQLWSTNQLGPQSRKSFDAWRRLGYSYALGVRTRVSTLLGGEGPIGEFGWDGAAGCWAMVDPHSQISAFFAMHVRDYSYIYDVIHPTIRSLIYRSL